HDVANPEPRVVGGGPDAGLVAGRVSGKPDAWREHLQAGSVGFAARGHLVELLHNRVQPGFSLQLRAAHVLPVRSLIRTAHRARPPRGERPPRRARVPASPTRATARPRRGRSGSSLPAAPDLRAPALPGPRRPASRAHPKREP